MSRPRIDSNSCPQAWVNQGACRWCSLTEQQKTKSSPRGPRARPPGVSSPPRSRACNCGHSLRTQKTNVGQVWFWEQFRFMKDDFGRNRLRDHNHRILHKILCWMNSCSSQKDEYREESVLASFLALPMRRWFGLTWSIWERLLRKMSTGPSENVDPFAVPDPI